jgi:hypothetical protein
MAGGKYVRILLSLWLDHGFVERKHETLVKTLTQTPLATALSMRSEQLSPSSIAIVHVNDVAID